jgi:hypothetical protein
MHVCLYVYGDMRYILVYRALALNILFGVDRYGVEGRGLPETRNARRPHLQTQRVSLHTFDRLKNFSRVLCIAVISVSCYVQPCTPPSHFRRIKSILCYDALGMRNGL